MPLSRDGLTGWPTEQDPNPAARRITEHRLNGFPSPDAPAALRPHGYEPPEQKPAKPKTADQVRTAQGQRQRQARGGQALLKAVCETYEVLAPIQMEHAGKQQWFSRSCQIAKCKVKHFGNLDDWALHVFEHHSSPEKDARWEQLTNRLEPREEGVSA